MTFTKLVSATYVGEPADKDERVIKTFLLFPRWIRGESKWLETAIIRQKFDKQYYSYSGTWRNLEFVNTQEHLDQVRQIKIRR